jgi:hypothetical protein
MKITNSFALALLSLTALAVMAYRGVDTSASIVSLCAVYITSRAAQKAAIVHSASKDENCETSAVIERIMK